MKKLTLLFLCGLFFAFAFKKTKRFIPPGTVQISDTLFADETEISNFSWQEYEFFIKTKYGVNSKEHVATLPDTNVWRDKSTFNEPYVKYYYRHPAYKDYPVVGISYEQAKGYCKWRTERVKTFLSIKQDFKHQNFEYRLPTTSEWEFLSNSITNCFYNNGKNKKGQVMFNHRWMTDSISKKYFAENNANPDVTAPTYSYWRNDFGLFCIFGNVAEMVNEKGISKGGSWQNTLEECRAGKHLTYTKPTACLGFRCVCIVLK